MCLNTPFVEAVLFAILEHSNILICSNLMFDHLCLGHCFWMAWDEIVFLQPSHFVRHQVFGSVIINFGYNY